MGGRFAQQVICRGLPYRSEREEEFLQISVDVRNMGSLEKSLENYVQVGRGAGTWQLGGGRGSERAADRAPPLSSLLLALGSLAQLAPSNHPLKPPS
jgi:hypothetical protein